MQASLGLLVLSLLVIAAESASPMTPAEVTSTSTSDSSGSGDRQGRLLLLFAKKALALKAPFLIAKGIGAKAGIAKASVVTGGVAGAGGLAGLGGLKGLSGVSGLTGLSGLGGLSGGRLVSGGVGSGGRLVYLPHQQYTGESPLVTVAKPIVVTVPSAGYHQGYYGHEQPWYGQYYPQPEYNSHYGY